MGPGHTINETCEDGLPPDLARLGRSNGIRVGKELIKATRPFAVEDVASSWWHVGSTFGLLIVTLIGSRVAWFLFRVYAAFALTPPRSWRQSHNYHHGHVGRISAASIGAFPVMTTNMWRDASAAARASYRLQRHPLVVLSGYLTIFALNICVIPLLREPKRYWDSAVVLLAHGLLIGLLWVVGGFDVAFFAVLLPMTLASALGSYLFFAQHSFKRMHIISPESWTYYRAALESSSYMRLNRLMQWFTGNIGYHHIHHLNVRIPFYRLPEAMAAVPELQSPVTTSLSPREIRDCFNAALWDEDLQRMVSFREASKAIEIRHPD